MWPDVWQHDLITLTLILDSKNRKREINWKENKNEKRNKKLSSLFVFLTLPSLQGFSSRETDFYFCQFLSNFLRYSSNFPLSHLYNIFAVNFPGSSSLLKSLSSTISIFSCLLTSTFILPLNFSNTFFVFPKSSFFSQMSCSTINPFHHTKYLSTSLIFVLFNIFSIFYSLTFSTSIGFSSSLFYSPTCSLYRTI